MTDPFERPAIAHAPLSVVLCAWNAGNDVEEVVAAWVDFLEALIRPYEILLVDDASTDETSAQAGLLAGRYLRVRNLRHETHQGEGAALRTGIGAAQNPLICICSCDKQFHPPDLKRAFEVIDQVDVVTGYRVGKPLPLGLRFWDGVRRMMGRVVLGTFSEPRECWLGWSGWRRRWLARWIFGLRVQDPECPYRLFRKEVFRRIPIQCMSAAARIEILAKANHLECLLAEVPVSWVPAKQPAVDPADRGIGKELRRLFFDPDFGPVRLSEPAWPDCDYQI